MVHASSLTRDPFLLAAKAVGADSNVRVVSSDAEYAKELAEAWASAKGRQTTDPLSCSAS